MHNAIPKACTNNRLPWATTLTSQWSTPTCSTQCLSSIKANTTTHMRCSINSRPLSRLLLLRQLRLPHLTQLPRRPSSRHSLPSQWTRISNPQWQIKSDILREKALSRKNHSRSGALKRLKTYQPPRAPTLNLSPPSGMKSPQPISRQSL